MTELQLSDINTDSIYFCDRSKTFRCIVGSYWDDGATLIACEYENDDVTNRLFSTESSCLTLIQP